MNEEYKNNPLKFIKDFCLNEEKPFTLTEEQKELLEVLESGGRITIFHGRGRRYRRYNIELKDKQD